MQNSSTGMLATSVPVDVVPSAGRGYITCGRANQCVVFDLKTLHPLGAPIPTGPKPDALLYDAFSQRVFLFSNDGGKSTVLNAATGLWISGRVADVREGLAPARELLLGGAVARKIAATREFYRA